MNTDETGLLHAIYDEPFDVVPRRVYADWLEEHGATGLAVLQRMWMPDGSHLKTDEWKQGEQRLLDEVREHCPEGVIVELDGRLVLRATLPGDWPADSVSALDDLHRWMSEHHIQGLQLPLPCHDFPQLFDHPLVGDLRQLMPQRVQLTSFLERRTHGFSLEGLLHLYLERSPLKVEHLCRLLESDLFPHLLGLSLPERPFAALELRRLFGSPTSRHLSQIVWHLGEHPYWKEADLLDLEPLVNVRELVFHVQDKSKEALLALRILPHLFPQLESFSINNVTNRIMSRIIGQLPVEQLRAIRLSTDRLAEAEKIVHLAEGIGPTGLLTVKDPFLLPAMRDRLREMLGPRFRHEM